MKNLLSFLITQITGSSDFEIMDTEVEQETTLIVHATPAIVGLIIGKEGKTHRTIWNFKLVDFAQKFFR
jgi:predicted RNA-binding protein YlqC (UPF0109 family)